jgi:hypothetical protein
MMFLLSYFDRVGFRAAVGLPPLSLISVLTLYLTDFLNRIFPGENAKNHAFYGEEKSKPAAVYRRRINQGAGPRKPVLNLRCLHLSFWPLPALNGQPMSNFTPCASGSDVP